MNHAYIDGKRVAESYLRHTLPSELRTQFEAHMVDCEECRDRLLLAEIFHSRNRVVKTKPAQIVVPPPPEPLQIVELAPKLPQRARFIAALRPWQIWLILIAAAALLVLIPTAGVLFTK